MKGRKEGMTTMSKNYLAAIMTLDVLIHYKPAMVYTVIGRSFFTPKGRVMLPGTFETWHNYYQS
ncbi:MAG: hypothetical protein JOS17DRAFT_789820 [Linnemannia elongata]|nr:MAG: hypothetical protein JOS17DRAFT_789820 [Linnemannia elongata]